MLDNILKTIFSILTLGISLIPTWVFLIIWHVLKPHNFWQSLTLFGVGFWALGFLQIIALILWTAFIVEVILD